MTHNYGEMAMKKMGGFKCEEFISIVGFYGNTALVDRKLMKEVAGVSLEELLQKGYYGSAVRFAVYQSLALQDEDAMKIVCEFFDVDHFDILKHRFGVLEDILKNDEHTMKCI